MCSAGPGGDWISPWLPGPPPSREQGLTLPLQGEEVDAKPPDTAEDLRDEVGGAAELRDAQDSCPGLLGTFWLPFPSPRCCSSTPTAPSATPPPAPT